MTVDGDRAISITNIALCAPIVQTRTILPDFQIGTIFPNGLLLNCD